MLYVNRAAGTEQYVCAGASLPHLILDQSLVSSEHGSKYVGMDSDAVGISEHIVEAALDIGDAPVFRSTRAGLVEQCHLIGDLIADKRQHGVEQVGQVHLGGF